jgi:cyclopropane fatty-acyl-phospholipid synthase-like methyltransferase
MTHLLKSLRRSIMSLTQTKKERRHALVGPARLWEMKRDFQTRFLKDMGLKPGQYLFDIGCGTLRGGIPLIDYLQHGHYFGVEVRATVLDEGRKELREAGLERKNPTLLLSTDISQLAVDRKFDYIWAFSVLIHMNDKILNDTLAFVSRHVAQEGYFYANVIIGERQEGHWQGFPVVARPFDFYGQACVTNGLVVTDLGSLKELGHISNLEGQDSQRMLRITRTAS